jgi:hypothetical protein
LSKIDYELLTQQDLEEAISCSVSAFINGEPTTKAVGATPEEFHYMMKIFTEACVEEGLSLIAKDKKTGQIIGNAISKDFLTFPEEGLDKISPSLLSGLSIFEKLENDYKAQHTIQRGELFHLLSLGVLDPFRLSNIGTQLVLEAHHLAQKHHFKGVIAQVSNPISQHILLNKFGYEKLDAISYQDFEYQGKNILSSITETDSCQLVIKYF